MRLRSSSSVASRSISCRGPPPCRRTWPGARGARIEVFQSTLDRAACKPRDVRDRREAAPSGRAHLARGKQPSSALVPLRAVRIPPLPNRLRVDHANAGSSARTQAESGQPQVTPPHAMNLMRFTYRCACPKQIRKERPRLSQADVATEIEARWKLNKIKCRGHPTLVIHIREMENSGALPRRRVG